MADRHGVSILLVHHLKKGGGASKDWLESLSGSMGLSATVDGLLALERDRGSDIGILKRSGRDLEDDEDIGLNWLAPCWEFNGSAVQMKLNATKKKILESIERAREPVKPAYIATDTGINSNTVRGSLNRMLSEGLLSITSDGKYMIPVKRETIDDEDDDDFSNRANTSNRANSPNSPNNQSVCLIEGESNSKSNSSLVSDTINLAPSVSTVSTVCYTGDISSSSGKPTEQESKQDYSETEARKWLKTNPEARRMYEQKRDRMMQTIKDKQHCFRVALKRTWEHFHK